MNEAKYELKNWKKWKRTISLLEDSKNQLTDIRKGISVDFSNLPGGNHKTVHEQLQHIIEERDKYDYVIAEYCFLVARLENAIYSLLTEEQKQVCIIYANYPNNSSKREYVALERGLSEKSYYRRLSESCKILNTILIPNSD